MMIMMVIIIIIIIIIIIVIVIIIIMMMMMMMMMMMRNSTVEQKKKKKKKKMMMMMMMMMRIIIIIMIIMINKVAFKGAIRDFFSISLLRREPCPTRTLKWHGRDHVQITYNTSSAYHVQHVVLCATWYEETAQLLSMTELKSHSL